MLAITPGEPAGIGPDIVLTLASQGLLKDCQVFACPALLRERAAQLNLSVSISDNPGADVLVKPIAMATSVKPGQLNPANADYVLQCLKAATVACLQGETRALVTGPIHKGVINEAGMVFSGHTEWLANFTNTQQVVMLLTHDQWRVVPTTRHIPLSHVSKALTPTLLTDTLLILYHSLKTQFHLHSPKILVCGLNPHAGEQGHLGQEEITVITPVLDALRKQGLQLTGPVSADTAFTPALADRHDAIVGMYHDQVLPVIKSHGFNQLVNVTLGLPIIRTSVDHGTALSLAGSGHANAESLLAAIRLANTLSGKTHE